MNDRCTCILVDVPQQPSSSKQLPTKAQKKYPKMREYFVKWEGKSYWECSWVLETGVSLSVSLSLSLSPSLHFFLPPFVRVQFITTILSLYLLFPSPLSLTFPPSLSSLFLFLPFLQLDVHQGNKLRPYMRKHNMESQPPLELPAHLERRRRRRSSHYDEKTEEKELMLLKVGIHPEWLIIQRVIGSK